MTGQRRPPEWARIMTSQVNCSSGLHLPDLTIQNFRGIPDLSIRRLGRVTLITGMNGVGKTTLLDAVRLFADRGSSPTLRALLRGRDELREATEEDDNTPIDIDWGALFHGREVSTDSTISIGQADPAGRLQMFIRAATEDELSRLYGRAYELSDSEPWILSATYRGQESITFMTPVPYKSLRYATYGRPRARATTNHILCHALGPNPLESEVAATLWYDLALKDEEGEIVAALNLVSDTYSQIDRIAIVGNARSRTVRPIVRRAGEKFPIPLKSLGEGAVRIFGIALTLASCQDGFLLIDEVENGIHHSVQERFWQLVLRMADHNNVQVLATTHSWDAVAGYARAASKNDEVDGRLVRIERRGERMRAVEYTEEELARIAETGSEVR